MGSFVGAADVFDRKNLRLTRKKTYKEKFILRMYITIKLVKTVLIFFLLRNGANIYKNIR